MDYLCLFERREVKYLLSREQRAIIEKGMIEYMQPDCYGHSTVRNVYYDTPDKLLIRRSIEKPAFKEKLRIRSYRSCTADSTVFVEIKKKYLDTVYKRREAMSEREEELYLSRRAPAPRRTNNTDEIDCFLERYNGLVPSVYISYEREAYFAKEDSRLRITFDENILWRDSELTLLSGVYGKPLLSTRESLMEIKAPLAMPLWLVSLLTKTRAEKVSFSKYGAAYSAMLKEEPKGIISYA